jgi:CubicO group peptidase (beta-lactamase class C family)
MSGFLKDGIQRMHGLMSGYVERGEIPGMVTLIARGDEAHVDALGTMAVGDSRPIERDAIFRVASITKPVTAVAAMILVEECRIHLDDAVDEWLPELSDRKVLKGIGSELDDVVPAKRAITVRDLFTFMMGFGSVMAMPGTYPIQNAVRDLRLGGDGPPHPSQAPGTDEWLRSLGSLPLMYQPGERWMYHTSADALGALVERVSGMRLEAFMRERIFEPLGMKDTAFSVPEDKWDRLPACYDGEMTLYDAMGKASEYARPGASQSGGGGLVSTADDFFAFYRMMLNYGVLGKERMLSRRSVELMTMDHLLPSLRAGAELFMGEHSSWGLGMSVAIKRTQPWFTPGRFGWDGGFGTSAYGDPKEDFVGILMTQRMMTSPKPPAIYDDFWTLAYSTLE